MSKEYLAREERVKVFQRLGDKRSIRTLYGGKPRTAEFVGDDIRVAHQRPTVAEHSPQIGARDGVRRG